MAKKRTLIERAKALGVYLDVDDPSHKVSITAPDGKVFAATGCHFHDIYNRPPGAWKASEMYDSLMEDMSMGIDDCEIEDCGICADNAGGVSDG